MFVESKYTTWYYIIIDKAKVRKSLDGYIERHHIIPKSLGGNNSIDNLVTLTPKEHFVVHHLLTKMCMNEEDARKMWTAFFFMHINPSPTNKRYFSSRTYEISKKNMSEMKSKHFSGENNHFFGLSHSKNTKNRMSANWNRESYRRADKKLYKFVHDIHGVEICTRLDLCKKYNVPHKRIHCIVKKSQNTAYGWRILWENEAIT